MAARPIAVRFAPSPTGRLHMGNARPAVLNWLFARRHGGTLLLRHDDTDAERSRDEYIDAIEADLRWLGLAWDRRERQSGRLARYAEVLETLKASGHAYSAYETAEELSLKRKAQLNAGRPPLYDRAALRLTPAERAALEAKGRTPHWRLRLDHTDVAWADVIHGDMTIQSSTLSDPVLVREDGTPLYVFTSVVDDIDFAISHVIRGDEHLMNTVPQIQLFRVLGAPPPTFAHFALLVGKEGEKLSKRLGALSLADLHADGIEAMAIASYLARLGSSDPIEPRSDLQEVAAKFDLTHFGRAPAHFDPDDLRAHNAKVVHQLPYAAARDRIETLAVPNPEAFWLAVRGNLSRVADAAEWARVVTAPALSAPVEDATLVAKAAALLPLEPWNDATWSAWTGAVAGATGTRGRALFHPLRVALTGRDTGPEMKALLPLIGRERVLARLSRGT
ncbi:MAG: glutamate--tRNA ligase [Alphaproteobacteria bacterium]|nr:glutamate--tRNA ligase [Alphaproteobacteria bacterium]